MILDKAAAVIGLAGQKAQARTVANQIAGFGSRARQVQDEVARLEPLVAASRLLRAHGIPVRTPTGRVQAALARVRQAKAEYHADAESVLGTWYRPASEALQELRRELEAELAGAWRRHVAERIPGVKAELLDILERVPAFRQPVGTIRQRLRELRDQQESLPSGPEAFDTLARRVGEIETAWQKLTSDEVPRDVVEFLRQAGAGGAPISLLTEGVRTWLAARGIESSFRIRLGGEHAY